MSYTVYIGTSIINLLTSQPARAPITRACQQLTRQWWHIQRKSDMCYSSAYADSEIRAGEPLLAESRLRLSAQHTVFSEEAAVDIQVQNHPCGGTMRRHSRNSRLTSGRCTAIFSPAKTE